MSKWVEGKIIKQQQWAKGLFSLWVEAAVAPFIPGQFTQLTLEEGGKLFRPYSYVNGPDEALLEFYYTYVEGGKFTPTLAKCQPGERIWVAQRAVGRFVISEVPSSAVLWLFATGTGLGVFLSLLKSQTTWEKFERIVLVHSVRFSDELTHLALIEEWQRQYATRFYWVPIVTRETSATLKGGPIYSQRMTDLFKNGVLEKEIALFLTSTTAQVMLCGNPAMVNEMVALLQARGLQMNRVRQPGQITIENYWK